MPPIEFNNLDVVYRRIDELAREVVDTPRAQHFRGVVGRKRKIDVPTADDQAIQKKKINRT